MQLKFEQLSNVMSVTHAPAVETVGLFQWYGGLHIGGTHQMTNHTISETPGTSLWEEIQGAEELQFNQMQSMQVR